MFIFRFFFAFQLIYLLNFDSQLQTNFILAEPTNYVLQLKLSFRKFVRKMEFKCSNHETVWLFVEKVHNIEMTKWSLIISMSCVEKEIDLRCLYGE